MVPRSEISNEVFTECRLACEVRRAERLLREDAEETFDLIEPRRARRREVEVHARVSGEPRDHFGRAVGRGVVEHHVELSTPVGALDLLHEREKVHRGVRVAQLMRDLAGRDLERSVEIDHAMALVIVRVASCSAGAKRQWQLSSLQRLDRGFLVHAEHDGVFRGIQVEAYDVVHLRDERRIAADLVRSHQMRLELVAPQDIGDAPARQTHFVREQSRGPSAPPRGRWRHRELHDLLDDGRGHGVVLSSSSRALDQAVDALVEKPTAYPRHLLAAETHATGDLLPGHAVSAEQDDPRPSHVSRRLRRPTHDRLERAALLRVELEHLASSHERQTPQSSLIPTRRRCTRACCFEQGPPDRERTRSLAPHTVQPRTIARER